MLLPYILRFQEHFDQRVTQPIRSNSTFMGTQTQTFVAAEAADPDPRSIHLTALPPRDRSLTGTETITNVRAESFDSDRNLTNCQCIPR